MLVCVTNDIEKVERLSSDAVPSLGDTESHMSNRRSSGLAKRRLRELPIWTSRARMSAPKVVLTK